MPLIYILELLLAGAVAGFGAGYLGIGGGAILTPVCLILYPALGVTTPDLVKIIFGTNMFLVTAFSISAALRHHRNSRVDWRTVAIMSPIAVFGSITGSWAASVASPVMLKKAFAVLLIVSSLLIILKGSTKPAGPRQGGPILSGKFLLILGFVTGFLGSFLGIGGGIVMIPALILLFALPVAVVAGTSSSIIIFIGIASTLSYMWYGQGMQFTLPGWSTGYVWWSAAIPLMLGGIPAATLGACLNAKTHSRVLQRIFGAFLLALALRILLS
ncbi:MAG: sulfite exporter TauE/SafE family protein [Candidatus Latescibacter sp.]|nr:sulfite exporter TauE/SafE family protein [Candidatus Latescibacter sp.]